MHDLNNCVDKLRFKADDAWPEQQEDEYPILLKIYLKKKSREK
jgi:hypothetical protein